MGEIVPSTVAPDENAGVPLVRKKIRHVNSEGDGAFFIKGRNFTDYRFRYSDATGKRRAIQFVDSIASLHDHSNTSRKSPYEMDDVSELEEHHLKALPSDLVETVMQPSYLQEFRPTYQQASESLKERIYYLRTGEFSSSCFSTVLDKGSRLPFL
jgi:hypothetical protein